MNETSGDSGEATTGNSTADTARNPQSTPMQWIHRVEALAEGAAATAEGALDPKAWPPGAYWPDRKVASEASAEEVDVFGADDTTQVCDRLFEADPAALRDAVDWADAAEPELSRSEDEHMPGEIFAKLVGKLVSEHPALLTSFEAITRGDEPEPRPDGAAHIASSFAELTDAAAGLPPESLALLPLDEWPTIPRNFLLNPTGFRELVYGADSRALHKGITELLGPNARLTVDPTPYWDGTTSDTQNPRGTAQ